LLEARTLKPPTQLNSNTATEAVRIAVFVFMDIALVLPEAELKALLE
jgi:hypothetical protein